MLNQISIAQSKLIQIESQRHRKRQSILPNFPPAKRLRPDVQIVRRHLPIFPNLPGEPGADAFINRMADVTPKSQRSQNIEVEVFRNGYRELNVSPLLIIRVVNRLGRRARHQ